MSERLACQVVYRFRPLGEWSPLYDVVACGSGECREISVKTPEGTLLWYASFRGALNSNRARIALDSYLKSEAKRRSETTCCNGDSA